MEAANTDEFAASDTRMDGNNRVRPTFFPGASEKKKQKEVGEISLAGKQCFFHGVTGGCTTSGAAGRLTSRARSDCVLAETSACPHSPPFFHSATLLGFPRNSAGQGGVEKGEEAGGAALH